MKTALSVLTAFLLILQYGLWFNQSGVFATHRLHNKLNHELAINNQLLNRNQLLAHEVNDLKKGSDSVEEHARNDIGMIKKEEKFYQYVE